MDHFPPADWIDLARSLLPPAQLTMMQSHLDQGCEECLRSRRTWGLVISLSEREVAYRTPEEAVRRAKMAFAPAQPERWLPNIAEFARLIFDSFKQSRPALIRASVPSSRLLLHEAEPFSIDLRLDADPVGKRVSLMGQILDSRGPGSPINRIDVVLLSGGRLVKKTSANASGEFDLDFVPVEDLQLFVNIPGERAIAIVLPDMKT